MFSTKRGNQRQITIAKYCKKACTIISCYVGFFFVWSEEMCSFLFFKYQLLLVLLHFCIFNYYLYFWPDIVFWIPLRKTVGDWVPFLGMLGLLQAVLWCTMMWSETHVQQVSRRFANLSYIVWIVSTCMMYFYTSSFTCTYSSKSGLLFYRIQYLNFGRNILLQK